METNQSKNPFGITSSKDLTDKQIADLWVDVPGGLQDMIRPELEMPMIIVGSKGSGKTHIMRYLSFPLQKIRHTNILEGVQNDGYIGIYMRCSGLNSARFSGKGISKEAWDDLFRYSFELSLAQLTVAVTKEILSSIDEDYLPEITSQICNLFDCELDSTPNSLDDLINFLILLIKEIDLDINNCALTGQLNTRIMSTVGKLVFGIPNIVANNISSLSNILFVYLIDEFENLTESQQVLINSYIRERSGPCTFKVGGRLYGIKTTSTLCDHEDNKMGSEYEMLDLDSKMRADGKSYSNYARRLVARRLEFYNITNKESQNDRSLKQYLDKIFIKEDNERHHKETIEREFKNVIEWKHRVLLTKRLKQKYLIDKINIESIKRNLYTDNDPLIEKFNIFLIYQSWNKPGLLDISKDIKEKSEKFLLEDKRTDSYSIKFQHRSTDLLAQLYRENRKEFPYAGFETLAKLSWGNPRHLLILLKQIFLWSTFNEEKPFENGISIKSQTNGVREASEWFFLDARTTGDDGEIIQIGVRRLAELFRGIRYSDKPSETSVSTFSYDESSIDKQTQHLVNLAEKWSYLVRVGDRSDRNSGNKDTKFQLNRLLAPKWDIPFSRRGEIRLNGSELDAIFTRDGNGFKEMLKERLIPMRYPFLKTDDKPHNKKENDPQMRLLDGN